MLTFFSLLKTIYPRVLTKPLPNDAKSPLPVDVRRLETLLLKLPIVAKYDHVTPTLINLHWLQVIYRVNFKIAMLAPEYLKDLIKAKSTTRYNLRSDGEMLYLKTVV